MLKIQVVGPGCYKCETLKQNVEQAVAAAGVAATIEKVDDPFDFPALGVNRTPAVLINGELKLQGRVATVSEITEWLGAQ